MYDFESLPPAVSSTRPPGGVLPVQEVDCDLVAGERCQRRTAAAASDAVVRRPRTHRRDPGAR
jgi:hypothetical protein